MTINEDEAKKKKKHWKKLEIELNIQVLKLFSNEMKKLNL